MSNVNLFCYFMLTWVFENISSTCIITKNRNTSRVSTKVFELLPFLQQLSTTRSSCNIFSFYCGHGNRVFFLGCPRYQTGSKKMSHTWGDFLLTKKPAQSASANPTRSKLHHLGYHKAKYLKIRLTAFKCDSLGLDWKRAHKPTIKTISGLLAVR